MNIKDLFLNFWGVFMGTTVQYVKSSRKNLSPSRWQKISDSFYVYLGGAGNCGVLMSDVKDCKEILLIDTNMAAASQKLKEDLAEKFPHAQVTQIINTHFHREHAFGNILFSKAKVWMGNYSQEQITKELGGNYKLDQAVSAEMSLQFGSHSLRLIPFQNCHSFFDLVIVDETTRHIFMGDLFFNKIHPVFRKEHGFDIKNWKHALQKMLSKYSSTGYRFVPGEGEICSAVELQEFIAYLSDLSDEAKDFSFMRKHYDWAEIEAYTSLEENFDTARSIGAGTVQMNR